MNQKYDILKKYFGYSEFREGQEILIDSILSGKDTVGIMPTGAGKSLCFQVPALCMSGITLVVSPLISLMKDQVMTLLQAGIRGAYLNSSLTYGQYLKAINNAKQGVYKIIYVAPERLLTNEFLSFAKSVKISMLTIDEAHCVSQWGHDFRPSYLKIREFIDCLDERPVISAFTATATNDVKHDIIKILGLEEATVVTTGFDRKNLYFEVKKPKDKFMALKEVVESNLDKAGIVYCSTRKNVEKVCDNLNRCGYNATRYHAGLSDEERRMNQENFLFDRNQIMVATNAFGMGIDKANVSYVVHYNMPKNMEGYYQEAGRAGRDGENAYCVLLYSGQDVLTNQFLIENSVNEDVSEEMAELIKQRDRDRLKRMTYYCTSNDCLREYILKYFGEKAPHYCGNCSSCNHNYEVIDISDYARSIVRCIRELQERYGIQTITDALKGSKNEKILRLRIDTAVHYGDLNGLTAKRIREIIDYLVMHEYLYITNDDYPVVKCSQKSVELEDAGIILEMKSVKDKEPAAVKKAVEYHDENPELFSALRDERAKLAKVQGVPAFVIFTDATLRDMCRKLPKNDDEMLEVSGIGYTKLQKYGKQFLRIIKEHAL